jgi:chemotaxis protein CheY-P-specific phosphatase CheC
MEAADMTTAQPLSPVQAELLRQILNDGNSQVGETLEMLLGQPVQNLEIRTWMESLTELRRKIPTEPVMAVRIGFEGDVQGQFLFMQSSEMSRELKELLNAQAAGHVNNEYDATSYVRSDWIQPDRSDTGISEERLGDVLGEFGNVLFGNYLTALYNRCELATFLEVPDVQLQGRHEGFLATALQYFTAQTERCFLVEVDCAMAETRIHFWLVMLTGTEGFRTMLEKNQDRLKRE